MARIYAKWTCPYCGEKISANNFKRHCITHRRTHPQYSNSETQSVFSNYESGITQQTIEMPVESPCSTALVGSDGYDYDNKCKTPLSDNMTEIFAFHLSSKYIKITEKCIYLTFTTWDDVDHTLTLYDNEIFISWVYNKVYIPGPALKISDRWSSDMERTYRKYGGWYKPVYGDSFYGRCITTVDRWRHREQTRKVV